MNWSTEQEAIFEYFGSRTKENAVVIARAGTGKTTTIIEGIRRAPERRIVMCAFNRSVALELSARIARPGAQAKTLHAIGFGIIKRNWADVNPSQGTVRAEWLTDSVCHPRTPDGIKRLVTKLHNKGREINPHARQLGDLTDLMYRFECDPDEAGDYAPEWVEQKALDAMELAAKKPSKLVGFDFSDMIYLPIRNRWLRPTEDMVVVDEAQDMTVAQLEMAEGICRGRICVVGDNRQAIYEFRGADSGSLERLRVKLKAKVLGLKTTYRCGHAIVELAQAFVPDIMAAPDNPQGLVGEMMYEKMIEEAKPGDFILSRTNAPLVSICLTFLKQGRRARIAGKDVGAGLIGLIRKLNAKTTEELIEKVYLWEQRQVAKLMAARKEDRIDAVRDKAMMITAIAEECEHVIDVMGRIEMLFSQDSLGAANVITCSSVHKAKGLEADRVFLVASSFFGTSEESDNLRYVAITRAKQQLTWVGGV